MFPPERGLDNGGIMEKQRVKLRLGGRQGNMVDCLRKGRKKNELCPADEEKYPSEKELRKSICTDKGLRGGTVSF